MRAGSSPSIPPRERRLWLAAVFTAALLQIRWCLVLPIGAWIDESVNLLLAKGLLHGSYSIIEGLGGPVNDPLPGFPALLAGPVLVFAPHWLLVRAFMLAGAWLGLGFVWLLARRAVSFRAASAVALLTALNPILLQRASLAAPDVWFCLLPITVLALTPDSPDWRQAVGLGLGCAVIALVRPQGAVFALASALGIAATVDWRLGALEGAVSLTPLCLWTLRNRLTTSSASGYLTNWGGQMRLIESGGGQLAHAFRLLATTFGGGALPLSVAPDWARAIVAAAVIGFSGFGAVRLLRSHPRPWAWAAAAYFGLLICAHLTWGYEDKRYALPLVPLIWIFCAAAWERLDRGKRGFAAAGVIGGLSLVSGLGWGVSDASPGDWPWPRTFAWIRDNTPPGALLSSPVWPTVSLATGRRGSFPNLPSGEMYRDSWLARLAAARADYVIVGINRTKGFSTGGIEFLLTRFEPWCHSAPWLEKVYEDPGEGSSIYRLRPGEALRFLDAWKTFETARIALRTGQLELGKVRLKEALRLEPRLALAWATMSELETDARQAASDLERAVRADPSSEALRADWKAAQAAAERS